MSENKNLTGHNTSSPVLSIVSQRKLLHILENCQSYQNLGALGGEAYAVLPTVCSFLQAPVFIFPAAFLTSSLKITSNNNEILSSSNYFPLHLLTDPQSFLLISSSSVYNIILCHVNRELAEMGFRFSLSLAFTSTWTIWSRLSPKNIPGLFLVIFFSPYCFPYFTTDFYVHIIFCVEKTFCTWSFLCSTRIVHFYEHIFT